MRVWLEDAYSRLPFEVFWGKMGKGKRSITHVNVCNNWFRSFRVLIPPLLQYVVALTTV